MGYRSDVGLVLSKKAVAELKRRLDALDNNSNKQTTIRELMEYAQSHYTDKNSEDEVYYWEWLKWYSDFPDVSFIERLMADLEVEDYLFFRVGEEIGDIEIKGEFWDNPFEFNILQTITLEAPR